MGYENFNPFEYSLGRKKAFGFQVLELEQKIGTFSVQVLIAVILAISFLIMSVNNQALLAITTMLITPAVGIFGNLLRNTFESLLFLFIVHPFDVGDRVFIEGVPLMVEVCPFP